MFYNQVKEYYLEYKDLPKINNNGNIGHWINYQKTYFNKNKLEKEKVELLLKICPDFFKSKKEIDFENWILIFNQVKEYYSSNNKLPTQSTKIGKWLILQRMYIKNNKLDKEKVNMFNSIINN